MKIEYVFLLPVNVVAVNESIINHFVIHGFTVRDQQENRIHFSKGRTLLNTIGFDLFAQYREIIVIRTKNKIYSYANISTFANRSTQKTKLNWRRFFTELEEKLAGYAHGVKR